MSMRSSQDKKTVLRFSLYMSELAAEEIEGRERNEGTRSFLPWMRLFFERLEIRPFLVYLNGSNFKLQTRTNMTLEYRNTYLAHGYN